MRRCSQVRPLPDSQFPRSEKHLGPWGLGSRSLENLGAAGPLRLDECSSGPWSFSASGRRGPLAPLGSLGPFGLGCFGPSPRVCSVASQLPRDCCAPPLPLPYSAAPRREHRGGQATPEHVACCMPAACMRQRPASMQAVASHAPSFLMRGLPASTSGRRFSRAIGLGGCASRVAMGTQQPKEVLPQLPLRAAEHRHERRTRRCAASWCVERRWRWGAGC